MAAFSLSGVQVKEYMSLPSQTTFIDKHIVPAEPGDKFYNETCALCLDDYSAEHPPSKILPCGHIFGLGCIHDMVEFPIGDTCPYCRTKLFRRNIAFLTVVSGCSYLLWQLVMRYRHIVLRVTLTCYQRIDELIKQDSWLGVSLNILFDGPRVVVMAFVIPCTTIGDRNPKGILIITLATSTFLRQLIYVAFQWFPVLGLVYLCFGASACLCYLVICDLFTSAIIYYRTWTLGIVALFVHSTDRRTLMCITAIAAVVRDVAVIGVFLAMARPHTLRATSTTE